MDDIFIRWQPFKKLNEAKKFKFLPAGLRLVSCMNFFLTIFSNFKTRSHSKLKFHGAGEILYWKELPCKVIFLITI